MDGEKSKRVCLVSKAGELTCIATIRFRRDIEGSTFDLQILENEFTSHFLSMRPFKCLEASPQTVCHVPYPYPLKNVVAKDNWRALEYRLLFVYKQSNSYGIDFWNGIYYLLKESDGVLVGQASLVDLNVLATPPEGESEPLITQLDLHPASVGKLAFPSIRIGD